jgi:steroid delta-isomerase-like uncharacterized protein
VPAATHAQAALGLFEAWERRDFDAVAELVAEDVTFDDYPAGRTLTGRLEFLEWFKSWTVACTDSTVSPKVLDAGDHAVIQGVWVGTNDGPFGPFPATGRRVEVPFAGVMRFDHQGQIAHGEAYYNQLSMLIQLGHAAPPAA